MEPTLLFIVISLLCSTYIAAQNNSITMDGTDNYIDLPDGIANYDNFTFEAWVYWEGPSGENWRRIFDFGNSSSTGYMFLTPCADDNLECNNLVIASANTFEIENTSHRTIHGSVWNVFDTKIKDNSKLTITGSLYMLHYSKVEIYPLAQLEIEKDLSSIFNLFDYLSIPGVG